MSPLFPHEGKLMTMTATGATAAGTMATTTRVLLADDHALVREGLRSLIEAEPGLEVVGEAVDGRAAAEMAAELSPDVVVMDVGMPHLNGMDATRQIKGRQP